MTKKRYEEPKIASVGKVTDLTEGTTYSYKDATGHGEKNHKHSVKKRRISKAPKQG